MRRFWGACIYWGILGAVLLLPPRSYAEQTPDEPLFEDVIRGADPNAYPPPAPDFPPLSESTHTESEGLSEEATPATQNPVAAPGALESGGESPPPARWVEEEPIQAQKDPKKSAAPAPALSAPVGSQSRTTSRGLKLTEPLYKYVKPNWGTEITGAIKAFPQSSSGTTSVGLYAIHGQFEYQPAFLQFLGILGVGTSAGLYPVQTAALQTGSPASVWSVGGQIRYQMRYWPEQPFVPMGGYAAEYWMYKLGNGRQGRFLAQGPFAGGMLLLNWMEPSAASNLYVDSGIARSYLLGEYRMLQGGDGGLTLAGGSVFFGLRIEF